MTAYKLNIKSWAQEDRPREKLALKGCLALSDAELIAILISSGNKSETAVELSKKILSSIGHDLNKLGKLTINDLKRFNGIGEAKAIAIIAAMELGRRRKASKVRKKTTIRSSRQAYDEIRGVLSDLSHEEFWVLCLNRKNELIIKQNISKGGVSGTIADTRIIFKNALEHLTSAIILCHNHPSGNLQPSEQDVQLTKKMKEAGQLLDIPVLDHLIVGEKNYFSFADKGLI
ncbi:MAG: DNA repair protein RadC [Flavobacteriales bacterium]|nr:DNA repair protein RadC [Flavobacteriales bacterium]